VVGSAYYCAVLKGKLQPAVYSKYRRMVTEGVLHCDSALHMAAAVVEMVRKLKF
jgi:hypothetical protein